MSEERGPWYLLTGLLIGAAFGLFLAWRVLPVTYTNTSPASLSPEYKDKYRAMIALAYLSNGDLVRARARLELLQDGDVFKTMSEQAQRMLAEGSPGEEARALGLLAVDLGQAPATTRTSEPLPQETSGSMLAPPSATSAAPTGTAAVEATLTSPAAEAAAAVPETASIADPVSIQVTPILTLQAANTGGASLPTPASTAQAGVTEAASGASGAVTVQPTPTLPPDRAARYALQSRVQVCEPALERPLIKVEVLNAAGEQVFGVEVTVAWAAGEERFFTGLKPELGTGFADFEMEPGVVYTLSLAGGEQPVTGLVAEECGSGAGKNSWGALKLVFVES